MVEASHSSPRSGAGAHGADVQHQDSSVTSYTSYTDCVLCARSATVWTVSLVEERLRKAAKLASALSDSAKPLIRKLSSRLTPNTMGIIGGIGVAPWATGAEDDVVVAMAAEALSWLRWLRPDDAGIVRARLEGASWKMICWRFDVSRPTADRRWRYALALIAWHLNGNATSSRTPSLRSMLGLRRAA